jgi:pyruvate formate lyase activating enzyme
MLDIKHIDPEEHLKLTAQPNTEILKFAKYLEKKEVPVWIRHVVVPGITDNPVYLEQLGAFIGSLHNLKALDVLPYHTMGESKYKNMGIPYPLAGVPAMDKEKAIQCKEIIMKPLKEKRKEWKNKEA